MMKKYTCIQITGLLLVLLCLAGCMAQKKVSTTPVSGPGDEISVQLESQLDKQGVQMESGYSHPYAFSMEKMALEVDSLVMKQFDMGKWNRKSSWEHKPLFTRPTAEVLPERLITAFARAGSAEAVAFTVPGRNNTLTSGKIFVKDNTLTWLLYKVDGMPFTGSDKFWMDSDDWRIEDAPQFTFYEDKENRILKVVRNLQVDKGGMDRQSVEDRKWRNEHYYQESAGQQEYRPEPPPRQVRREAPAPAAAPPRLDKFQSMEEKLEVLKNWSDKGIISEEEYGKEKEKILNQLQ